MKELLSALLVLILALSPSAALAENWYAEKGVILAERMHMLASDEAYINTYLSGNDDVLSHISALAASDFSAPTEARMLSLPDAEAAAALMSLLYIADEVEMPQLSETGKIEILKRLPGTFISAINGQYGVTMVAASSVLTTSETFIMPDDFQPGVLFLQYPGEYSVAVAFCQSGEETVTVSAMPVSSDYIPNLIAGEDLSILEKIGMNLLFQKIELD